LRVLVDEDLLDRGGRRDMIGDQRFELVCKCGKAAR
jgi:hypothetical protein